ncbi:phosphopantetheine-binding protein [Azospirillum sp. SYSU D00513]|uniref:phosphopantetheine-binding protein n=1 Tax=Azospirillum sp. SYSU D00513 TaxID=2812561 RepID=UPI001A96A253|nr:phosphopantetheine-binding protein [Azospirillum sp. SYSU D00513]
MNRTEFLLALDDMLELPAGTLTGTEELDGLEGWDSLGVISFIALVDERTQKVVEAEKLAQAKTVGDLLALAGVKEPA